MVHLVITEDLDRLLSEAIQNVKNQSLQMRNCFDHGKLMDGLKFCSTMLNELRTSDLSPKGYYALYMAVVDELRYLEDFLMEEVKKNIKITDIYELVQYAGNIIPRLYLLITVGIVYIRVLGNNDSLPSQNIINKRSEVIKDLVEMCRGVQHPLRGLFLRYYLLQSLRNTLPDNKPTNNEFEKFSDINDVADDTDEKVGINVYDKNININALPIRNLNGDFTTEREMTTTKSEPINANGSSETDDIQTHHNDEQAVIEDEEDSNRHLKSFDPRNAALRTNSTLNHARFMGVAGGSIPFNQQLHISCSVLDSLEFLLSNFGEMNKLWVRMQHLGHSKDRDRRETERKDLRLLVGTNLVRMSELDNMGIEEYKKVILPGILEQIISCRDVIAQEYLMECIIQVFPDEFHLATLNTFLKACAQLNPEVKIKNIMICLINRLATYAQKEGPDSLNIDQYIKLFDVFSEQISNIIQSKSSVISPEDIVSLQNCLINLALTCYIQNLEYVDRCLETTSQLFTKMNLAKISNGSLMAKEVNKMVRMIIEKYCDVDDILRITKLKNLPAVMKYFVRATSYDVCGYLILKLLEKGTPISEPIEVNDILTLVKPILAPSTPTDVDQIDDSDEVDAQIEFAKLINLVRNPDTDKHFMLLKIVHNHLDKLPQIKIKYSVPTIVFNCLKICTAMLSSPKACDTELDKVKTMCHKLIEIIKFVHGSIFLLGEKELHELAIRMYLQGSNAIDEISKYIKKHFITILSNTDQNSGDKEFNLKTVIDEFESIAYEFMSQCFSIYEDDIADSKTLFNCLNNIVATFYDLSCFTPENHESLRRQSFSSASKLLKKPDQARALCFIAHIFWSPCVFLENFETKKVSDGDKVMNCLNKAAKITNQCLNNDVKLQLFTDILNTANDLKNEGCKEITDTYLDDMIAKINRELIGNNGEGENSAIVASDEKDKLNPLILKQYLSVEKIIKEKVDLSEKIKLITL